MPAEITTGRFCADYFSSFRMMGDSGIIYTVAVDYCSCPAFQYAPEEDKTCKHTMRLFKIGCFWNEQWYDGGERLIKPEEGSCTYPIWEGEQCPNCGGPVCPVRIAV